MRAVVTRVSAASVTVEGRTVGQIGRGEDGFAVSFVRRLPLRWKFAIIQNKFLFETGG